MLKNTAAASLALCALAACGAPQTETAATGEAATAESAAAAPEAAPAEAAAPRVSATQCQLIGHEPGSGLETFYSYSDNDPLAATGIAVEATPGTASCTGREFDVACQVRGPSVLVVSIQDYMQWRVPAGRTATFTQRAGASSCFLNEPG